MAGRSRWDEVSELLAEAGRIAPAEREAYLRNRTADESVRSEVLSLLAVEMPSGDLLEGAAFDWYQPGVGTQENLASAPRLGIGEVVAGRFHIEAFLGRGGMGEVYKAEDRELGERVALKLLHPELANQAGFLDRFRREIRLARKISHPNVARVFDLVQEPAHPLGALHFYVLELLNGETLAERIKRDGAMGLGEALEIAKQMAGGLAAVHVAGVLHRDFKPANVMLTEGRAVVTDFGLAAPIVREAGPAGLPTTSLLLGTPGYVAPEQWAGKPATVATDVYSFGIVLHEMVAGRHPNAEGPRLEGDWSRVVAKCLEMEPASRYPGPLEAVAALEPRWLTRRRFAYGLGGAVAAAGLVAGFNRIPQMAGVFVAPGTKLLLVPPPSLPTLDGAMVSRLLYDQLRQSSQVEVIDPSQLSEFQGLIFKKSETPLSAEQARHLALRSQAPLVLFAGVSAVGSGFTLNFGLEALDGSGAGGRQLGTASFAVRGESEMIHGVHDGVLWVRKLVGESSESIASLDHKPEAVSTPSWDALREFTNAERTFQAKDPEGAILAYDAALRYDHDFAMAWMRKADVLSSVSRSSDSLQAHREALKALARRPVSVREELRIRGMIAQDTNDNAESERAYARYVQLYPNDYSGYFYRTRALWLLDREAEGLTMIQKALALKPDLIAAKYGLIGFMCHAERCEESRKVWENENDPVLKSSYKSLWHFCRAEHRECIEALHAAYLVAPTNRKSRWAQLLYSLLSNADNVLPLRSFVLERISIEESAGNLASAAKNWIALAYIEINAKQSSAAITCLERATDLDRSYRRLRHAVRLALLVGDINSAKRFASMLDPQDDFVCLRATRNLFKGQLAMCEGRADEALIPLLKARAEDHRKELPLTLAECYLRLGNRKAAWNELREPSRSSLWREAEMAEPGYWKTYLNLLAKSSDSLQEVTLAKSELTYFNTLDVNLKWR